VADVTVTDNCPNPSFVLTSVTSNEPENDIGDGNTEPDIVGASTGTADTEFQLRSERMGPRSGRIYTIVYTASDNCGNTDVAEVEVRVEHDQGGNAIVVVVGGSQSTLDDDYLAVVVPAAAAQSDEALAIDQSASGTRRASAPTDLLVGNTAGVVGPARMSFADVDGDGVRDAIALVPLGKVEALRAQSTELDGPVGLHYGNELGESFLLADLLAVPPSDLASPIGETVLGALGGDMIVPGVRTLPDEKAAAAAAPAAPIEAIAAAAPRVTRLAGFRPNPFLARTSVAFELARPSRVMLDVYAPNGTRVRALADVAYDAGAHAIPWDGRDDGGRRVPAGVYFVRFAADGVVETGKALLLP